MRKIYKWYSKLTKREKDSIIITMSSIGVISTFLSVLGLSLADIETLTVWLRIVISVFAFIVLYSKRKMKKPYYQSTTLIIIRAVIN